MRRTSFAFFGLLLLLAAPAAAQERPALRASLAACESGPVAQARFAVFTASMPARMGSPRMSMRFDLLEQRPKGRWHRVYAPAFGRWERSKKTGASGFVYTKRVEHLKERAKYRAVVRFRWLDSDGAVQRELRRVTPVCAQPWQRPNLVVEKVDVLPAADPAMARYLVTVVNTGLVAAAPFTAGVIVGIEEQVRDVAALAPGGRTTVEIPGPRCQPPGRIAVQLDVRDVVHESNEDDNRSIRACDGR